MTGKSGTTGALGLVHLYCGDGKGKTTAALGLLLRAVGSGCQALLVQFLKDGDSSEIALLRTLPGVTVLTGKDVPGFTGGMSDEQKETVRRRHQAHFDEAVRICREGGCGLLVLDEAIGAVNKGLLDGDALLRFLRERPDGLEVVLTGRDPQPPFVELSDYVSEICKRKHPYDRGITARKGVEK